MAGFPTPFPLAPLDPAWGLSFQNPNPFDTHPPLLQFNNSLKEDGGDDAIDDVNIDVDGLHDAANFILGNTLHYTPHNFHQPIIIPYPTTIGGCYDDTNNNKKNKNNNNSNVISLPVCDKCKRHYKTRDICRIKHGHTDVPWTNTYICITIDKSCIDNNGKYIIRNDHKLYVVNLPSPPQLDNNEKNSITTMSNKYVVNSCLDEKAPVCLNCKQSNRSRAYCRKKFRHRELPWNTLFVMLKLQQQHVGTGNGSSGAAGSITFQSSGASSERDGDDGAIADFLNTTFRDGDGGGKIEEDNNKMPPLPTLDHLLAAAAEKEEEEEEIQEEEPQQTQNQKEESNKLEAEFDINCIAPSRTFLSIISSTENSIRWLTNIAADDNNNCEEMLEKSSYQQQSREIDFLSSKPLERDSSCRATVSVSTKTKKRKKASSTASTSKNKSKKQKPLDNAALALQAIEYAKQQAKKEQDTALLMTQRFTRFAQQPLLMQQQQQQQLLLQQQQQQQQQQQAMYQLQDTTEQQRKLSRSNDQPYGDEAMQVAEINEPVDEDKMPILNGEDILDEAAKLAEWL